MPNQHCFICASDEGIFLDITTDEGKSFAGIFETCLSVKINEKTLFSNKICYKCAYELGQCNTFVKKYKESREAQLKLKKNCCILCVEVATKGHSFDITKDKRLLNDPLQKIQDLFQEDVQKHYHGSILMCLTCRYTLDILFDLKNLFKETAAKLEGVVEKELNNINFNKIKTSVVSRKTTTTESTRIRLSTPSDSESDVSTMTRSKRKQTVNNNKETAKDRACDQCHALVKTGDMYRFHQTGQTVCKVCWSTMDPVVRKSTRKVRRNSDTKLCTVFLEDVLKGSNSKDEKSYKVEKDKKGNVIYVISDDSSEEGASLKNSSTSKIQLRERKLVTRKKSSTYSGKQPAEGKSNRELQEKGEQSDKEEKVNNPKKKVNNKKKRSSSDEEKKLDLRENKASVKEKFNDKREGQNTEGKKSSGSTSEEEVSSEEAPGKKRKSIRQINRTNPTSNPDNDFLLHDTLRQRKKLRLTNSDSDALSPNTRTNSKLNKRTSVSDSSQTSKEKRKSFETGTSEENMRITRNSRLSANLSLDERKIKRKMSLHKKGGEVSSDFKSPMRKKLKAISKSTESSNDFNSSEESFNCPIKDKDEDEDKDKDKDEDEDKDKDKDNKGNEKSILFNCSECEASFENKLEGLSHQLTHFQRVQLKLYRVKMPEKINSKEIESAGSKSSMDQLDQSDQLEQLQQLNQLTGKDESVSGRPEEGKHFQDNEATDKLKDVNKDNENNRENIVNKNGEIKVIIEDKDDSTSERRSLLDNLNGDSKTTVNDPVDRVTQETNQGQSRIETDKSKEKEEIEKTSLEEENEEKEDTEKSPFEKEQHNREEEIDRNTEEERTKEFSLSQEEEENGQVGENEEQERGDKENEEPDKKKEQTTAEKSSFSSQEKEEKEERAEEEEEEEEGGGSRTTDDCSRQNENCSPAKETANPKEKVAEKEEKEEQEGNEDEKEESIKETDCTKRNEKKDQNETEENENLKDILLESESEEKEVESETEIRIVDSESFEDNEKAAIAEPIRELEVNKVQVEQEKQEKEEEEINSIKGNDREATDQVNELTIKGDNGKSTGTSSPTVESKTNKKAEDDETVPREVEQLILPENSNDSNTEAEVIKEVFDLAEAELRNRQNADKLELDDTDSETLENISREIHNNIN